MTLRVAVTGISGDVGRGTIYGLRQNLPDLEPIWLLGLDAGPGPHSMPHLDRFARLPLVKDRAYVDELIATLHYHAIDVLLLGIDSEILILSAARHRLATSG